MGVDDIRFSVMWAAIVVFSCSLMNLLIFLIGLRLREKALHPWFMMSDRMVDNIRKNIYFVVELSSVPACSLVMGLCAVIIPTDHLLVISCVCLSLPLFIFAMLKVLFLKKKNSVVDHSSSSTTIIDEVNSEDIENGNKMEDQHITTLPEI